MSTKQIIAQIAKNNGVTQAEVEKELLKAINFVLNSKDPTVIKNFKDFFNNNLTPSVDDIIKYCVTQVILKTL